MTKPYLAPALKDQGYIGSTGGTPYKPANAQQLDTLKDLVANSAGPHANDMHWRNAA